MKINIKYSVTGWEISYLRIFAIKLIMGDQYKGYLRSLNLFNMENLNERREILSFSPKMFEKCKKYVSNFH